MEKINIANLLKDCPTGYPLDCTMYEDVYFDFVDELNIIHCYIQREILKTSITFNQYGTPNSDIKSKCVIFPKGKTTWEGFHRPFKDGDVLYIRSISTWICIYKEGGEIANVYYKHVATNFSNLVYDNIPLCQREHVKEIRLATEQEKAKLFKAIKDRGYKWNSKTKTLEILIEPNFKVGDWITNGICKSQIHFITDTHYWYSENCILGSIESVDKQYHLWTINDAKDGDVLFHSDSASNGIFIFKEILQRGTLQKVICHCDYDSEDGFCLGENHTCCWTDSKILHPATKEHRDLLFQKMKGAGYKWNTETKTLEELVTPKFTDGDIVALDTEKGAQLFIFKEYIYNHDCVKCYMMLDCGGEIDFEIGDYYVERFATKEEKQKLFKAIKDNGYYWDAKNKVLEVLIEPKFKVGDRVRNKNNHNVVFVITSIEEDSYCVCGAEKTAFRFNDQDDYELINEPKFKVGNRITNGKTSITIGYIDDEYYYEVGRNIATRLSIKNQDEYNLIPHKFDINTLIPFESKVLVRHNKDNKWTGSFFSFIDRDLHSHCYKFVTTADKSYPMMIPFKGNEYLLGKTDDCQDFYKTWE